MAEMLAYPLPKESKPEEVANIKKLIKALWDNDDKRQEFIDDPIKVMDEFGVNTKFLTEADAAVVVVDPQWDIVQRNYDRPQKAKVYYAVIPPEPPHALPTQSDYENSKAWEAAWQRATEYGYGM